MPPIALWTGIEAREGARGPLLEGALGWVECSLSAEVRPATTRCSSARSNASEAGRASVPLVYLGREVRLAVIEAVVFDLDGVLLASEEVWDEVRERFVRGRGGRYDDEVQRAMMGMSSSEWSRYLHEEAGVPGRAGGDQPRGRAR